jgi:hypothetical protein
MHRLPPSSVWYAYEAAASFLWALPFPAVGFLRAATRRERS